MRILSDKEIIELAREMWPEFDTLQQTVQVAITVTIKRMAARIEKGLEA